VKAPTGRTALAVATAACASMGSTMVFAIAIPDYRDTLDRAVAIPDAMDQVDPTQIQSHFNPFVADDIAYDSNIYRLPTQFTDLSSLNGISRGATRGDTDNSATAGLDAEWLPGNRQTIDLDLRVDDNRYFHNSDLDNISSQDRLVWNWGLGSALSGQVGADYTRQLAGFLNTVVYSKNSLQEEEYFAAGRYQIGPRWAVFGGILDSTYSFTNVQTDYNNSKNKNVEFGADYQSESGNRLGADYRYTDARYPNSILLNDVTFDPDNRQDRIRLVGRYIISDKTLIDAYAGYLKRTYPSEALGGFSGEIWRASFQWQATPKTQLVVGTWQDLDVDLTAQTDYFVSKGVNIEPIWTASEKLAFSLSLSREMHDYVGANPTGDNSAAAAATLLTQSRRDTVTGETGSMVYTPTTSITVTVNATHEVRGSNIEEFRYNDNRGDASINFKF
jgi:hypothetical protein